MYYPLTTTQRYFYEYQKKAPESTMYNMYPMLIRLHNWVDLEKLADSIVAVNEAHPAVSSIIEEHNGEPMQRYISGLIARPHAESLSEVEFMTRKDNLIQPFYPGEPMCRFRIFQTEKAKYFFIDTYHIICDAVSKCVWVRDLDKAYAGQEIPQDSWLSYIQEMEAVKSSPRYDECRRYYEDRYNPEAFVRYPKPDFDSSGLRQGLLLMQAGIYEDELKILKKCRITRNEFFIIVSMLATASFNNTPDVMHTWTYHGRSRKELHSVIGLTLQDFPVALNFEGMTLAQVFTSIREQVKGGLRHSDYPYTILNDECTNDDFLCVTYQGSLYRTSDEVSLFNGLLDMDWKGAACQNIFDAEMRETDGRIELLFDYPADIYRPETIEKYFGIFVRCARNLLDAVKENNLEKKVLCFV